MKGICKAGYARACILAPFIGLRKLVVYSLMLTYYLAGGILTMEITFVVIAFYNWHSVVVLRFIPQQVSHVAEVMATTKRIQVH